MRSIARKTVAARLVAGALLSISAWLVGLHGAEAGVNAWTTSGPDGGTVYALAIDPQAPTTLYAGTRYGGLFRSADGGHAWAPPGLTYTSVVSLAVDPRTPTTL